MISPSHQLIFPQPRSDSNTSLLKSLIVFSFKCNLFILAFKDLYDLALSFFQSSFTSFIQNIFFEHLCCAKHASRQLFPFVCLIFLSKLLAFLYASICLHIKCCLFLPFYQKSTPSTAFSFPKSISVALMSFLILLPKIFPSYTKLS